MLAVGLTLAQLGSVAIHLFDRGSSVYRLASVQLTARIGQTARILNRLPPEHRGKVVDEIRGRNLRVVLSERPVNIGRGFSEHDPYERQFTEALRQQIGAPWPVSVNINPNARPAGAFELWMARYFYFLLPQPYSIVVQVGLEDGSYAVFDVNVPQEPLSRLESLVPLLLLMLLVCFALAAFLVRMITRSLDRLARAADAFGQDPASQPLPEQGPSEIRRVIAAFNRMQERVRRYLVERGRLLGAISHDLKTPITRLRLRTEMLEDDALRAKFVKDLADMESMVTQTLDFMRDASAAEPVQKVDLMALLESLQRDYQDTGNPVEIEGRLAHPYSGRPLALRRCLTNLVDNALRYGKRATLKAEEESGRITIRVLDEGPGMSAEEFERAFEPFFRGEASRSRETGGSGLGLGIARNIARAHGGELTLRNRAQCGLEAILELPQATLRVPSAAGTS